MATILNPEGLLDYGDNDGTVIWQSPLTTEASISSPLIGAGTYAKVGTGQVFDSSLGMKNGASGYYTVTQIAGYQKLDFAGQVTFDMETAMLACSASDSQGSSGGRAQTANEIMVGFKYSPAVNANYTWYVSINAKALSLAVGYGANIATGGVKISDVIGKGQSTQITVAWSGSAYHLFVNKVFQFTLTKLQNNLVTGNQLVLGTYPFTPTASLTSGYIRNLQISTRPYTFSSHPILARVQVFGDSYADSVYTSQSATWDMEKSLNMEQEFIKLGIRFGSFNPQSYGGRKVIGSGNAALYLIDNVATALAQRPTLVIFQGGANDLTNNGTLDTTAFSNGMKAIIERFFGVNGNTATTVQRMGICSTPWAPEYLGVATALLKRTDINSIQSIQAGLPAWFDATYPALAGRLAYQDTFTDFGGFNPDPRYYDLTDLQHPIGKGRYVMGKSWASLAKKLMRS